MKQKAQYIIPFSGLKEGKHEFHFTLKDEFFEEYELLEAEGGELEALVILEKKPQMLLLDTQVKGFLTLCCDRCLEEFDLDIFNQDELIVKFGEQSDESSDEIWIVSPNEHQIDMQQYIFELIGVSIPIQKVHPDDEKGNPTCDEDTLQSLYSETDNNNENKIDPRWEKLKDIYKNNNNGTSKT